MKKLYYLFPVWIVLIGVFRTPGVTDYWRMFWSDRWFFLLAACTSILSLKIYKKYHWSLGLSVFYVLMSALWVLAWKPAYGEWDMTTNVAFGKITGYAFLSFFTVVTSLLLMDKKIYRALFRFAFPALCLADSAVMIYQYLSGIQRIYLGGIFGNTSMSGCFIAFSFPFLTKLMLKPRRFFSYPIMAIPVIATILCGASQPVAILAIVAGAAFVKYQQVSPKKMLFAPLIFAILVGIGYALAPLKPAANVVFWGDSGRFFTWGLAFKAWWNHGHIWFGQGTGITQVLLPLVQYAHKDVTPSYQLNDMWIWFHSDYLQALFENGIIGLGIHLITMGFAIKFAWKKSVWVFSSLCGVLATSVFNFTVHWPIQAYFAACLVAICFEQEESEHESNDATVY